MPRNTQRLLLSKLVIHAHDITSSSIVQAIRQGDRYCLQLLDNATRYLAVAFSIVYHGIGVDKFIIIGGFANACGTSFRESVIKRHAKTGIYGKT